MSPVTSPGSALLLTEGQGLPEKVPRSLLHPDRTLRGCGWESSTGAGGSVLLMDPEALFTVDQKNTLRDSRIDSLCLNLPSRIPSYGDRMM